MVKRQKRKYYFKVFAYFYLIYGIVFIIIDRFDFPVCELSDRSIINIIAIFPESFQFKFINFAFAFLFSIASFLLIKNIKEAWYLYNIAFIGIILKYFLIFLSFSHSNILIQTGFHLFISIFGLVFINLKRTRKKLTLLIKSYLLNFIIMMLISFSIVFLFAYGVILAKEYNINRKEHYKDIIYDTHTFMNRYIDSCIFAHDFLVVLDTLKDIEDYSMIKITDFDSTANSTYSELLSENFYSVIRINDSLIIENSIIIRFGSISYKNDITTNIYLYNHLNNLLKKDEFYKAESSNSNKYFSNDSLIIFYDHIKIYLNEDKYIERIFITSEYNEQIVLLFNYNKLNNIIRIDIRNNDEAEFHNTEIYYYDDVNILTKSIVYNFWYNSSNNEIQVDKGITIYKSWKNRPLPIINDSIKIDEFSDSLFHFDLSSITKFIE